MTEDDARRVWLLRAYEWPEIVAPWSAGDRDHATAEAARRAGADVPLDRWLAERAVAALPRLERLQPELGRVTRLGDALGGTVALLLAGALLLGLAIDALGSGRHVSLIHAPLVGMVAWNLVVYGLWMLHAFGPWRRHRLPALVEWWSRRAARRLVGPLHAQGVATRFAAGWIDISRPLRTARLAAALHAAAALVAVGAIASMYVRGIALEYRAVWESTFLDAGEVHAWLHVFYAPAAWLTGIALPDAATIAGLAAGGPGENAARWIHLMAATVALLVVLPRAALAAHEQRRALRLAQDFPLALDDPYAVALDRQRRADGIGIRVLPYGMRLEPDARAALEALVRSGWGPAAGLHLAAPLAIGDELGPDAPSPSPTPDDQMIVLFPLTATPEHEHHGVLLERLRAGAAPDLQPRVWIDESAFAQRFGWGAGERRLAERREAWRRFVAGLGFEPEFVRLDGPPR